jgi:hypothetical protein
MPETLLEKALDPATIVGIIAAIIALAALVISVLAWRGADRAARNDMITDVRSWGDDVVDSLSLAIALCKPEMQIPNLGEPEIASRRMEILAHISSQIDRGRFFFANLGSPEAYQGGRAPILNLVLLGFELCASISGAKPEANVQLGWALWRVRRVFVQAIAKCTRLYPREASTPEKYAVYLDHGEYLHGIEGLPKSVFDLAAHKHDGFEVLKQFLKKPQMPSS